MVSPINTLSNLSSKNCDLLKADASAEICFDLILPNNDELKIGKILS
jgi:hypothetical protein